MLLPSFLSTPNQHQLYKTYMNRYSLEGARITITSPDNLESIQEKTQEHAQDQKGYEEPKPLILTNMEDWPVIGAFVTTKMSPGLASLILKVAAARVASIEGFCTIKRIGT
jgi:hypothetical protein